MQFVMAAGLAAALVRPGGAQPAKTTTATTGNSLLVIVTDRDGRPVPDAVAFVPRPGHGTRAPDRPLTIVQRDMTFQPFVLAVQTGSQVSFPNRDRVAHHLRTRDGATNFEFPVYEPGSTPKPVRFDNPGASELFCLFHLSMRGYVYAVDTPHFATTDTNGSARIEDLPDGDHEVRVWHPDWLREPARARFAVRGSAQNVGVPLDFKPRPRPQQQRHRGGHDYKEGQGA